jgi:aminoglycoside/choline kinase family phosphotransferase
MSEFRRRLDSFLILRGQSSQLEQLTPDASTREYFRIQWDGSSAIACVYPDPFKLAEQTYLDVTGLFLRSGLPVATILDFDEEFGTIILEDLGDNILRDEIHSASPYRREELINQTIDLIPRIQAATSLAFELGSIASKLKFDTEKLLWELNFFKEHYFSTFKKTPLDSETGARIEAEFTSLAKILESKATVLCHRDFHAANLMIDQNGSLRIIDHQDARIGSPAYDLVSLLLDRVTELPTPEWLAEKRNRLITGRISLGLPQLDESEFASEFRLQTIQRCLKAVGTFSFQSATRGKTYFIPFIKPMFRIVLRAVENVGGFTILSELLTKELEEK